MTRWRYSLRWMLRHLPCPGERELISVEVAAGEPAPDVIMSRFVPGSGYAVTLDFTGGKPVKRWSAERKAAARRRNLERRVRKHAPLFADELIDRQLAERPEYFEGK
ncbi:theronine dehydrogenase [Atlantibacter hermannii]|uniref:theronine dehydrogenase n=1 Tax=Atlantibacter hermannii TaxID=565 RepID=UPI0028978916|nr:theronine dehydrogenase [Atlantibacter hermannii]